MARVRDFVEHRACGAREAASGVEREEVVAVAGEKAGLEEVGVEVGSGEQRPRRAEAGEGRTDGSRSPHRCGRGILQRAAASREGGKGSRRGMRQVNVTGPPVRFYGGHRSASSIGRRQGTWYARKSQFLELF